MKCILVCLLILVCGFLAPEVSTLKCVTPDGLQVDEVRRVIKKCMKKIATSVELKNYDEYENFESEEPEEREDDSGNDARRRGNNDRMNNNYDNNYNPRSRHDYDYPQQQQQAGGNYREMNRRRNDRHDPSSQSPSPHNPYQLAYADDGSNNSRRGSYYGRNKKSSSSSGSNNNDNSTVVDVDKHERDRSCILQCFFQELKMVCLNE
jgi:hypothetical protein